MGTDNKLGTRKKGVREHMLTTIQVATLCVFLAGICMVVRNNLEGPTISGGTDLDKIISRSTSAKAKPHNTDNHAILDGNVDDDGRPSSVLLLQLGAGFSGTAAIGRVLQETYGVDHSECDLFGSDQDIISSCCTAGVMKHSHLCKGLVGKDTGVPSKKTPLERVDQYIKSVQKDGGSDRVGFIFKTWGGISSQLQYADLWAWLGLKSRLGELGVVYSWRNPVDVFLFQSRAKVLGRIGLSTDDCPVVPIKHKWCKSVLKSSRVVDVALLLEKIGELQKERREIVSQLHSLGVPYHNATYETLMQAPTDEEIGQAWGQLHQYVEGVYGDNFGDRQTLISNAFAAHGDGQRLGHSPMPSHRDMLDNAIEVHTALRNANLLDLWRGPIPTANQLEAFMSAEKARMAPDSEMDFLMLGQEKEVLSSAASRVAILDTSHVDHYENCAKLWKPCKNEQCCEKSARCYQRDKSYYQCLRPNTCPDNWMCTELNSVMKFGTDTPSDTNNASKAGVPRFDRYHSDNILDDLLVTVEFSDKDFLGPRGGAVCETWLNMFPHAFIYTDSIGHMPIGSSAAKLCKDHIKVYPMRAPVGANSSVQNAQIKREHLAYDVANRLKAMHKRTGSAVPAYSERWRSLEGIQGLNNSEGKTFKWVLFTEQDTWWWPPAVARYLKTITSFPGKTAHVGGAGYYGVYYGPFIFASARVVELWADAQFVIQTRQELTQLCHNKNVAKVFEFRDNVAMASDLFTAEMFHRWNAFSRPTSQRSECCSCFEEPLPPDQSVGQALNPLFESCSSRHLEECPQDDMWQVCFLICIEARIKSVYNNDHFFSFFMQRASKRISELTGNRLQHSFMCRTGSSCAKFHGFDSANEITTNPDEFIFWYNPRDASPQMLVDPEKLGVWESLVCYHHVSAKGMQYLTSLGDVFRRQAALVEQTVVTPLLETCSIADFIVALRTLVNPKEKLRMEDANRVEIFDETLKLYKKFAEDGVSCRWNPTHWPISSKKLIINVGSGTSGTRWVHREQLRWGIDAVHNDMSPLTCDERTYPSCTTVWDEHDAISDSPVAFQTWELVKTHPNGIFLLSMRDGLAWQNSRIVHHVDQDSPLWNIAAPCGVSTVTLADPLAPIVHTAYEAWAKCIIEPKKLYAFNVFAMDSEKVLEKMHNHLRKRGAEFKSERDDDISSAKLTKYRGNSRPTARNGQSPTNDNGGYGQRL